MSIQPVPPVPQQTNPVALAPWLQIPIEQLRGSLSERILGFKMLVFFSKEEGTKVTKASNCKYIHSILNCLLVCMPHCIHIELIELYCETTRRLVLQMSKEATYAVQILVFIEFILFDELLRVACSMVAQPCSAVFLFTRSSKHIFQHDAAFTPFESSHDG